MNTLVGKRFDFRAIVNPAIPHSSFDNLSIATLGTSVTDSFGRPFYEGLFEYTTPGDQPPIVLPPVVALAFTITPGVGGGVFALQVTTDPLSVLQGDPSSVVWVEWPHGEVSSVVQDSLFPCTALRVRLVSGTCRISLRGC